VGGASVAIGCLVLASTAAASGTALPSACTLLAGAHPEKVFGHGKTLAVTHRKSQKYGSGKYATFQCTETVGTQAISLSVASSNGGSGGIKITSQSHPTGLGSGATLTVGTAAGSNAPVDFISFHRGAVYVVINANGATPATLTTFARAVYKLA
jgi:hypothetical protein